MSQLLIELERTAMKIYVDYDDCICETARAFTGIADKLFGKKVPYEMVRHFNLQESFELTDEEISETISAFTKKKHIQPEEIILGNAQLEDITPDLRKLFGHNLKIYSSFNDTIRDACKLLHIRGGINKKD